MMISNPLISKYYVYLSYKCSKLFFRHLIRNHRHSNKVKLRKLLVHLFPQEGVREHFVHIHAFVGVLSQEFFDEVLGFFFD